MRSGFIAFSALLAVVLVNPGNLAAQPFRRGGVEFNAMREVALPADKDYRVAVVEFLHHGQINADGNNVLVCTRDQKPVATRVLQLGPGDFCRLAFEVARGQKQYEIFYGGEAPPKDVVAAWSNNDGLLLETRVYRDCNPNSFESVRDAFNASRRIGSDYVDAVLHANNPFSSKPEPFLSRYVGYLHISAAGTYGFMTSSQDCSFLLIDGKLVVEAPGVHRPAFQARPGMRKDIKLTAGAHKFEYYHAATGPEAMMVAAWEPSPAEAKPKPQAIPSEYFRAQAIGRAQAGTVTTREERLVPDFMVAVTGDVPLPDNDQPLLCAQFTNRSPPALTTKSKILWDFGDGQTSEAASPIHIYLHPGLYTVKLTVKRGLKPFEMTNRIYVDRPHLTRKDKDKLHKLDDYLPILATYHLAALDAAGLKQLVLAYQWKINQIIAPAASEEDAAGESKPEAPPKDPRKAEEEEKAKQAEIAKYRELIVAAGKAAFMEEDSAAKGDEELHQLACLVGPTARDQLGDSLMAGKLWAGAAGKISRPELKAECEIEAADIAINDLGNAKAAQYFLDAATAHLPKDAAAPLASRLRRVWGDFHAMSGNSEEARKAYLEAEALIASTRNHTERIAWQGAFSRSTEQFLKSGELARAAAEIRTWEREFPADRIDGYLTLLYARYWAAREEYARAIALSEQLLVVNPASPYIDQLLVLAADCEVKRGQPDRALATLHALLKDYPGSPLVPVVRKNIAALESGEIEPPGKRGGRPSRRRGE